MTIHKYTEMPGVDTISSTIVQKPPKTVDIGAITMKALQEAQTIALHKWMAIIPYCIVCKVPLTWVRNSSLLFKCPKCGMRWKKARTWDEDMKGIMKAIVVEHGD